MYYLEDIDTDKTVFQLDRFDREAIKEFLAAYFKEPQNKENELWYYKVSNDKNAVGDDYINFFFLKGSNVCTEVIKGNKRFNKKVLTLN